ncbi:hypothetical protein [Micromonospora sp. LH3U1]|uniref:hypothetical protein n=1 Tax=Micromonospora sp. LH3U1 TaxID=3018339 RepID=UPI002349520C|nr:hypothetical protein [Micromonospora sp. LH3U1]WCN81211.1 hypothetical protein PCA76_30775 [Micromonospora sp. LH3U1]
MDPTADDRLRSAVLFGAAMAVLAVGGWWWHAAAPAPTAGPATPPTVVPSAEQTVSTALDRAVAAGSPDARGTVYLFGQDEVVRTEIDPATGMITDIEGDPAALFFEGDLPDFRETLWRERTALAPGQRIVRQAAGGDSRQLLQYRCTRPGTMVVTISGAGFTGPFEIDCDGAVASAEVLSYGKPFRVSLSPAGDREIDVEAQLVTLPR